MIVWRGRLGRRAWWRRAAAMLPVPASRRADPDRIGAQGGKLAGIAEQRQHAVADEGRSRLVSSDQQEERRLDGSHDRKFTSAASDTPYACVANPATASAQAVGS